MAASLNKVMLIGNLGADPVIRQTQDGKRLAQLSLATSESWKDKSTGEKKEKTSWHRIVIFNDGLAGVVESYLKKGSKVYVEGQLQTRKFTDQSGQEKYTTEVVLGNYNGALTMLDSRGGMSSDSIQDMPSDVNQDMNNSAAPDLDIDDDLEYNTDILQIHKSSIEDDDKVLIIDDLIATGGTAEAAAKLINFSKGKVAGFIFVINLFDLKGSDKLVSLGYNVENLINFPGHWN